MTDFVFDQNSYLQRINFTGDVSVNIESLIALHSAHLHAIPFENFDICLNRGINLEPGSIFQKIVNRKRGGYCFEVNGLFLMALQSFGFDARAILARVHKASSATGRGHQLSLISFSGEEWIGDVGFGSTTPRAPIPLVLNKAMINDGQEVRLIHNENYGVMLQTKTESQWVDAYSFDKGYVCSGDIEYGNHYTSTSKNSFFTTSRVAALPIKGGGNIVLQNNRIKKSLNGREEIIMLEENETYIQALETYFGIKLDASYKELKPLLD